MFQQRFIYLISREFANEASPEERYELQQLINNNALLKEKYKAFKNLQQQRETDKQPDVEKALSDVLVQIREQPVQNNYVAEIKPKRFFNLKIYGVAASIILLIGLVYIFSLKKVVDTNETATTILQKNNGWQEKQNANGIRSSIVLSDGSKIYLNADSKLDYPNIFEDNTREVYLSGEAFFEVTKNPSRPFIIHLDNGTVRVLGTSFNIKAYKGSTVVETSVSTGRVAFIPKKTNAQKKPDTTFLTHDLKAVYNTQTQKIITMSTISNDDKAWTNGTLIFKAQTFNDIAIELERTFGKKIIFADDEVKQYVLTGSFENNSLDEILYYLSLSKPFTYKISDEEIVIGKIGSR